MRWCRGSSTRLFCVRSMPRAATPTPTCCWAMASSRASCRRPRYTNGVVQEVARKAGLTMAEVAQAVRDARLLSDGPAAFRACLADSGLRVSPGQKAGRWVVEAEDGAGGWVFAGALHRLLLKVRLGEADEWLNGRNIGRGFDDRSAPDDGKELGG